MTSAGSPVFQPHSGRGGLDRDQRLLLVTGSISLFVHLVVVASIASLPLGRVDPAKLAEQNRVATVDRIVNEDNVVDDSSDVDQQKDQQKDLNALSQMLLDQQDAPPSQASDATTAQPDPGQLSEGQRISELIRQMAATVPQVNLPGTSLSQAGAAIDVEVRYANPKGGGTGAVTGVTPGVHDTAIRLLGGSKGTPVGIRRSTELEAALPSILDTSAASPGIGTADAPLHRPRTDFLDIAKLDAAQVRLPRHLDDDFEYALAKFLRGDTRGLFGLGKADDDKRGYFRLDIIPKRSLRKLTSLPKDIVFLIDTSGSVPQSWVDQIVVGVDGALNRLNKGDRFNIVFFDEDTVIFSPDEIRSFDSTSLAEARQFLKDRKSSGYTDVNRALSRLVVRDLAVARVYDLIMISDGKPTRGLMDTRELINMVTRDFDLTASIYCIGVGPSQNRELLEFLAYRNKGICVFVGRAADAANTIDQLASRLRFPIIKDVKMNIVGMDADEVFPRDLANIHQAEVFSVYGRYDQEKPFTVRITGRNGKSPIDFTVRQHLANAQIGDQNIASNWAFWKLHHLYSLMIRQGETKELKQGIKQLRQKYKLKTLYQ